MIETFGVPFPRLQPILGQLLPLQTNILAAHPTPIPLHLSRPPTALLSVGTGSKSNPRIDAAFARADGVWKLAEGTAKVINPVMSLEHPERFPPTHWSLIAAAREGTERDAAAALDALCRTYWQPLYAFARRRGVAQDQAADVVQGFLSHFIGRGDIVRSDPQKGRFRTFLLSAFQNYFVSELRREQAQKRGGLFTFVALEEAAREEAWHRQCAPGLGPEQAFDIRWAQETMRRALTKVEEDYRRGGNVASFHALRPTLMGELEEDLASVGRSLGITAGGVGAAVFRLRAKFREALRFEVSRTVAAQEELEEEVRYLVTLLGQ